MSVFLKVFWAPQRQHRMAWSAAAVALACAAVRLCSAELAGFLLRRVRFGRESRLERPGTSGIRAEREIGSARVEYLALSPAPHGPRGPLLPRWAHRSCAGGLPLASQLCAVEDGVPRALCARLDPRRRFSGIAKGVAAAASVAGGRLPSPTRRCSAFGPVRRGEATRATPGRREGGCLLFKALQLRAECIDRLERVSVLNRQRQLGDERDAAAVKKSATGEEIESRFSAFLFMVMVVLVVFFNSSLAAHLSRGFLRIQQEKPKNRIQPPFLQRDTRRRTRQALPAIWTSPWKH